MKNLTGKQAHEYGELMMKYGREAFDEVVEADSRGGVADAIEMLVFAVEALKKHDGSPIEQANALRSSGVDEDPVQNVLDRVVFAAIYLSAARMHARMDFQSVSDEDWADIVKVMEGM